MSATYLGYAIVPIDVGPGTTKAKDSRAIVYGYACGVKKCPAKGVHLTITKAAACRSMTDLGAIREEIAKQAVTLMRKRRRKRKP